LAASCIVWPELPAHDLGTVARHLGVDLDHHHAGSDANAAACMILAMLAEKRTDWLQMIVSRTKRIDCGSSEHSMGFQGVANRNTNGNH
jgi:DNA polymerase III alpha subunit (gram-positive type)